MKLLFSLSLRNLFRQKRRNLLLGTALAFGTMILIMATSFAHGISDILLNRMVIYMTGHIQVAMMEKSKQHSLVIRDKDSFVQLIQSQVSGIRDIQESITTFARAVGNGKSENMVLVGLDTLSESKQKELLDFYGGRIQQGSLEAFIHPSENTTPVMLFEDKAKALNVKINDSIKIRFPTISGQQQTASVTVAAILKADNMFQGMSLMLRLEQLKKLRGFKPWETGSLQIVLQKVRNPAVAIEQANHVFDQAGSETAVILGQLQSAQKAEQATVFGLHLPEQKQSEISRQLSLLSGKIPDSRSENGALLSSALARSLGLKIGDRFNLSWQSRFGEKAEEKLQLAGIFELAEKKDHKLLLLHESLFYHIYQPALGPRFSQLAKSPGVFIPSASLQALLAPEWQLLPRSSSSDELQKKMQSLNRSGWKGPSLDIRTMYESASQVLDLEKALKIVSVSAVMILFFIILIGVINTLRMTIRERTREIGTVRAIGMQKNDIRNQFILETLLLAFFSSLTGVILAFLAMGLVSSITIQTQSVLAILLLNNHIYFLPEFSGIVLNVLLILVITAATAYFPAKRAASLTAAAALRHYE